VTLRSPCAVRISLSFSLSLTLSLSFSLSLILSPALARALSLYAPEFEFLGLSSWRTTPIRVTYSLTYALRLLGLLTYLLTHYAYKGYLLTYALRLGGLLARRGLLIRATHTILTISFTYGAILDLIPIALSLQYLLPMTISFTLQYLLPYNIFYLWCNIRSNSYSSIHYLS